jgi:hypothetical protein
LAPLWFSPYILGLKTFVAHVFVHLIFCVKKQVSIIFGSGLWKYFYPFHFFFLWLPIWKMQNSVELLMDLNPEHEADLSPSSSVKIENGGAIPALPHVSS